MAPLTRVTAFHLFALVLAVIGGSKASEEAKAGRCPPAHGCGVGNYSTQCSSDPDCQGALKCCPTGCAKTRVCQHPVFSACEHARHSQDKRARALRLEDPAAWLSQRAVTVRCREDGAFEQVQCGPRGECWCVDGAGYEIGGTRAAPGIDVNCTAPRPCAGPTCRMLCPYDFELDEEGCPLCRCRDPCAGIKCPGSLRCQLEEVECEREPCPPVPDCKSPRALSDACPVGAPLSSGGAGGKPFPCGSDPDSPKCPPYFSCIVDPAKEYGVCCPSVDTLAKPGTCPNVTLDGSSCEGTPCLHDMECEGLKKCCHSDGCEAPRCVPMAEGTKCLEQKILAQLLSSREHDAMPSYVPQCTASGAFEDRQCSRNGRVCWCVDAQGDPVPRTVGDSSTVLCDGAVQPRGGLPTAACRTVVCNEECPLGFVDGPDGCPTCRCKDPCPDLECPKGTVCDTVPDPYCPRDELCAPIAICRASAIEFRTKPGTCPTAVAAASCGNITCRHDWDCGKGPLKCCSTPRCPNTCVEPAHGTENHRPSMCEYLWSLSASGESTPFASPMPQPPSCDADGRFNATQCDGASGVCRCVDEFGAEVFDDRNATELNCQKVVTNRTRDVLACWLDCDYGLGTSEGGKRTCECRHLCKGSRCPNGTACQMVPVSCGHSFCPPLPLCVPVPVPKRGEGKGPECPVGKPLFDAEAGVAVDCVSWASSGYGSCPPTHFCLMESGKDVGRCCPQRWESERVKPGTCPRRIQAGGPRPACSRGMKWDMCEYDADCPSNAKCCSNECGVRSCIGPLDAKPGQCPLLIGWAKTNSSSCDPQCDSDADCEDDAKCCYNGCSLSCTKPHLKTGCQLRMDAASGLQGAFAAPRCKETDGSYEPVQCDAVTGECWCSDGAGRRMPGSLPNCMVSKFCEALECEKVCGVDHSSYRLDHRGCPTCECRDECAGARCEGTLECRTVHVSCSRGPCAPIPICTPSAANPCEFGEPLLEEDGGARKTCARGCPSTHRCQVGALGDFSACCPKNKEVCVLPADPGTCAGSETRWRFDPETNGCVTFNFSGCAGNQNNFASESDCHRVCPARSKCERLRDAALRRNGVSRFLPKCKADGTWEALQCLPEVGVCWCSTAAGAYVAGSAVRGVPECQRSTSRSARKLDPHQNAIEERDSLCGKGLQVHLCPANLCDGKVCLAHPGASCRVDPCGGCRFAFYSRDVLVDCSRSLSPCQRRVQLILNSPAWRGGDQAAAKNPDGLVPLTPPTCAQDGSYETLQTRGRFSWCVDSTGRPSNCSGSVLPVCPDQTKVPKICSDQCLDAYCEAHPEALCVADPCEDCRVSFVSPSTGETLVCEDPCLQPVEVGPCRGAITSWYFDHEDGSCKTFLYGGCHGNDNRFSSREECVSRCEKPADICSLPKRVGVCRASMKRWFFEKKSRSCKVFVFGGCDGNANNFETKEECEARCPDVVLCNRMEIGQGPKVCVRSQACANVKCPGDPFAVCTADPCTMQPYFVDEDGERISCEVTDEEDFPTSTETDPDTDTEVPTSKPDTACHKRLERVLAANSSSSVTPVCDSNGDFKPTQCDKVTRVCWCVDEAGQTVVGSGEFPEGHRQCAREKVKSVSVHLSYAHEEDPDAVGGRRASVRKAVLGLLSKMAVQEDGIENDVSVEVSARTVDVRFTLVGERKLVAAASLEDEIAAGTSMALRLEDGLVLRLDRSASTVFQYRRASGDSTVPDDGRSTITGAAVAIAVVAAVLTLVLFALIMVHRRRSRGYFPSGGSETSSVILTPSVAEPSPRSNALEGDKLDGRRGEVVSGQYESLYVSVDDRWQSKA